MIHRKWHAVHHEQQRPKAELWAKQRVIPDVYLLQPGGVVDYEVDYHFEHCHHNPQAGRDSIHSDRIGEYQSEKVKICFDKTSAEVKYQRELYDENQDIKQADLNKLGYKVHLLRPGPYAERVLYGCKRIDCKKVFTVRSQFQLVNFTDYDYLIYFWCQDHFLMKFLEAGDSLPLPRRLDDFSI